MDLLGYLQWKSTTSSFAFPNSIASSQEVSLLEIDIVMSISLFMLITYYSVMIDTNEHD